MSTTIAIAVLVVIVAVPAGFAAHKMSQDAKRGCGRGCATCKNFDICHGQKRLGYSSKADE